jgi:hypothetical protein
MVKASRASQFFVEPTDYGWSVREGSTRVGLFVTQGHALTDVRKRRAKLRAIGHESTLSVTGSEPEPSHVRPSRPTWTRR